MADVEQRAEAEAAHKGLSGGAARAYVGGVFNRIRQAHSRGTQPGKGARHLQRRARVEARQEARNRIARHEQLGALEKLRMRMRTRQEEPRKGLSKKQREEAFINQEVARYKDYWASTGKHGQPTPESTAEHVRAFEEAQAQPAQTAQPAATGQLAKRDANKPRRDVELTPVNVARDDLDLFDPAGAPDPARLRRLYGDAQLYDALNRYDTWMLKMSAREQGVHTGGSRQDIIKRLMAKAQGQPAPTPAQPAATGQAPKQGPTKHPELKPLKIIEAGEVNIAAELDPYRLRDIYGDAQLRDALDEYTTGSLREAVEFVKEQHPGTRPKGRDRKALLDYIVQHVKR